MVKLFYTRSKIYSEEEEKAITKVRLECSENKLTQNDFWFLTTIKKTDYGFMLRTKTSICQYGQAYKSDVREREYKERYLDCYYKLYCIDYKNKKE